MNLVIWAYLRPLEEAGVSGVSFLGAIVIAIALNELFVKSITTEELAVAHLAKVQSLLQSIEAGPEGDKKRRAVINSLRKAAKLFEETSAARSSALQEELDDAENNLSKVLKNNLTYAAERTKSSKVPPEVNEAIGSLISNLLNPTIEGVSTAANEALVNLPPKPKQPPREIRLGKLAERLAGQFAIPGLVGIAVFAASYVAAVVSGPSAIDTFRSNVGLIVPTVIGITAVVWATLRRK
jgi:hypothetical protein